MLLKLMRRTYASAQTTDFEGGRIRFGGSLEAVWFTAFGDMEFNAVWFRILMEN